MREITEGEPAPLRPRRFVTAEVAQAIFRTAPPVGYARLRSDLDRAADPDPTPTG